ncbi:MAG: S-adenosylmethionine:tRNA ribosyltransferase-isomerase [Chthoniobacter sp.]
MLRTRDYDYTLPDDLIARHPLARREDSRMMVLHRDGERIEHRWFREFPSFLRKGDLVVLNDTRVIPARVFADGGKIELLFLEAVRENVWKCLVKPGRKMRIGATVEVRGVVGVVEEILPDGERVIAFGGPVDLDAAGELPLPALLRARSRTRGRGALPDGLCAGAGCGGGADGGTAFHAGNPRAGAAYLCDIARRGRHFSSVQVEDLAEHRMHAERFRISEESARAINAAQRLVAVGTTTARVLESQGLPIASCESSTDIFIHPPYRSRAVGALLTNFHLPKSTLLMLVSALAGREFVLRAYAEAIAQRYRFYSLRRLHAHFIDASEANAARALLPAARGCRSANH